MNRIFLATACSLAAGFIFVAPVSEQGVPVTVAQPVTRSLSLSGQTTMIRVDCVNASNLANVRTLACSGVSARKN